MADNEHCLEAIVADDKQTVGCMVWLKSESLRSRGIGNLSKGRPEENDWTRSAHSDWHF